MSHSPQQSVALNHSIDVTRLEFDDVYEEIEEYADGEGGCLASLSALAVATVALGITSIMMGYTQ